MNRLQIAGADRHFNSIKVRLKRNPPSCPRCLLNYFNSINVRLKLALMCITVFFLHFNSMKVRLKLRPVTPCATEATFQFHKGTIKTAKTASCLQYFTTFQFHKGTIKTHESTQFCYITK